MMREGLLNWTSLKRLNPNTMNMLYRLWYKVRRAAGLIAWDQQVYF